MNNTELLAKEIHKATANVENCRARLNNERDRLNEAQKNVTTALNDMNNAEKIFDALVEKLRETNKKDTDWDRHPAESV